MQSDYSSSFRLLFFSGFFLLILSRVFQSVGSDSVQYGLPLKQDALDLNWPQCESGELFAEPPFGLVAKQIRGLTPEALVDQLSFEAKAYVKQGLITEDPFVARLLALLSYHSGHYTASAAYFRAAALREDGESCFFLACMHFIGRGVPRDDGWALAFLTTESGKFSSEAVNIVSEWMRRKGWQHLKKVDNGFILHAKDRVPKALFFNNTKPKMKQRSRKKEPPVCDSSAKSCSI